MFAPGNRSSSSMIAPPGRNWRRRVPALASARAAAVQARGDFSRAEQLVGKGFVSNAVLDQRRALAGSAEASIAGAAAAVSSAETLLSYLTIRAPVSGRTGELGFRRRCHRAAG